MKKWTHGASWRAGATAALLLVAGGVMGVVVDRIWLAPPETHATPLTAEAMTARLGLSSAEEAHLRALLDSLHAQIRSVVREDPDSLRAAVRNAQRRIEAVLPADARAGFRAWMREHHERLMGRMHGGSRDPERLHGEGPKRPRRMGPPNRAGRLSATRLDTSSLIPCPTLRTLRNGSYGAGHPGDFGCPLKVTVPGQ